MWTCKRRPPALVACFVLSASLSAHDFSQSESTIEIAGYQFGHDVKRVDVQSTLDALAGPTHQHFVTARINGELQRAVLDTTNRSAHFNFNASRVTPGRVLTVVLAVLWIGLMGVYRMRYRHAG